MKSPQGSDFLMEYSFEVCKKECKGELGVVNNGRFLQIQMQASEKLNPLEVEMALYQIAHILANETYTRQDLLQEKRTAWV